MELAHFLRGEAPGSLPLSGTKIRLFVIGMGLSMDWVQGKMVVKWRLNGASRENLGFNDED